MSPRLPLETSASQAAHGCCLHWVQSTGAGTHKRLIKKLRFMTQSHDPTMSSVQQGESSLLRLGNTVFLFNLPQRNNPIPSRLFFELLSYMIIFDPADGLSLYYFSKSWHFTAASHLTFMLFSLMPFGMFVTCPLSFLGTRLEQSNAAISRCHIYTIEHKKKTIKGKRTQVFRS